MDSELLNALKTFDFLHKEKKQLLYARIIATKNHDYNTAHTLKQETENISRQMLESWQLVYDQLLKNGHLEPFIYNDVLYLWECKEKETQDLPARFDLQKIKRFECE